MHVQLTPLKLSKTVRFMFNIDEMHNSMKFVHSKPQRVKLMEVIFCSGGGGECRVFFSC